MPPFAQEVSRCRVAQQTWAALPVRDRLRPVGELRHLLVDRADALTAAVQADVRRSPDEVIATDLLPTAAAAKFLLTDAARILKPRRVGWRPLWLLGCRDTVYRRPWGVVGLIGTWNYPVYITAVPLLQALVAGNGVLWKPSEHTPKTADALDRLFRDAGFPPDLLTRLPGDRDVGAQLAEADVDFVHFTGSDATGRKLAARLGERLVPSVLELSGVDAVIVRADADVELAARTAWYGATLNAGRTCMASRRVYVDAAVYDRFVAAVKPLAVASGGRQPPVAATGTDAAHGHPPQQGAVAPRSPGLLLDRELTDPVFAPVLSVTRVADDDAAVARHNANPFGLTAAVFTRDTDAAVAMSAKLRAGAVVVNDVIVPTAHPATPFGGRGASGWGVTQGAEGLLQLTAPQPVTVRRGRFRPHVDAHLTGDPAAGDVARGLLRLTHGRTLGDRWRGLKQLARGVARATRA
jgi:acyl-CoA reductase-like NAD-dependent aldehyde dehydrogenase